MTEYSTTIIVSNRKGQKKVQEKDSDGFVVVTQSEKQLLQRQHHFLLQDQLSKTNILLYLNMPKST